LVTALLPAFAGSVGKARVAGKLTRWRRRFN
jgi:hypothetical protein